MSANKTKPTTASVQQYIASRATAEQKSDCKALMTIFKKLTGHRPRMWGPSIVGYGSCRYRYESGRTGEMPLAAFAIRGRQLVVYLDCEVAEDEERLTRLGKYSIGKSCLYFRRLDDLDQAILEQLIADTITRAKRMPG